MTVNFRFRAKWLFAALCLAAGVLLFLHFRYFSELRGAERLSEPLRRASIVESVYGIGTVMTNKRFLFRPGIVTTVQDIFVKEGDTVRKGERVISLEHDVVIAAPFAGTITSLPTKVGENVFIQSVIFELTDLQDRYVRVSLEQRAAIRVKEGQKARLSFENLREMAFDGTVVAVYSSGNDFLVRIEVVDLPSQILPGMTADVAIFVGERAEALLVPIAALKEGTVRVRRGNSRPFTAAVKTGLSDGSFAEILSGDVRPGDRVVLPGKP